MQGPIKFRGKRTDNGEWVIGDLIHERYDMVFIQYIMKVPNYGPGAPEAQYTIERHKVRVDPATVGEFTGMVGLYEGDLCKDDKGDIVEIVWSDDYQWGGKILEGCTLSTGRTFPLWQWNASKGDVGQKLEKIGNRWDNPELMEGKNND